VSVRQRALGAFVLLLVLFLSLVFVQLVVGDRLQDERTARADRITRAREANRAVLQFMTDTETGVRGFQLTGSRNFLEPYESGRVGALGALSAVEEDPDSEVQRLVGEERQAASRWLYAYAIPIVNAGTANADEGLAGRGKDMFDKIRTANSAVEAALATEQETTAAADRRPERTAELLFATLAVLTLATGVAVLRLAQWTGLAGIRCGGRLPGPARCGRG
jgi:two-component system phosphate regulon sensor histidine kinase PhoR